MYTVETFYRNGLKANEASFSTKEAAFKYADYAERLGLLAAVTFPFEEVRE